MSRDVWPSSGMDEDAIRVGGGEDDVERVLLTLSLSERELSCYTRTATKVPTTINHVTRSVVIEMFTTLSIHPFNNLLLYCFSFSSFLLDV